MHTFPFWRIAALTVLQTVGLCGSGTAARAQTAAFAWQYSTPEEQGVDSARLAQMFAQIQRERIAVHSFVLVRHDRIVTEAYVFPYTAATKHAMYSVSKSFTSALLGIAIERGLISGVDARVADLFAGVTTQPLAEKMGRMTLRHLLTMSTGHATDTTSRITGSGNWARAFMELPVEEEPGSRFVYNSGASYMIAAAVQRAVGTTAAAFARDNLFGPLGITDYLWDTSPNNVISGGWGLSIRPLDMARFGLLYLRRGQWEGRQVVPASWVDESSRRQMNNGTSGFWGSGYGYQFWLNDFGGYRADGAFAQYIFILPDYDAVAVFTSQLSDSELPARLMRQYVLPAMRPGEPLVANRRANAVVRRAAEALQAGTVSAPTFTALPVSQTVAAGATVTMTIAASGSPVPTYQWFKDERPIPDATNPTLTLTNVAATEAGEYVAVVRNSAGALASPAVTLSVTAVPLILRQPVALLVATGAEASLDVEAAGGDLQYQWQREGAALPGQTDRVLRLSAVTEAEAGAYRVVVTNPRGSVTSNTAILAVAPAEERARLVNLSARALAGAGDQTLIVGLVIDGPDRTKGLAVLLRSVGSSLETLGVEGCLEDPATVLFAGDTAVASNSEWGGSAALRTLAAQLGAYPLQALGADAAMRRVLLPRSYTMHIQSSLPDQSGIVLAECYDAAGAATTGSPRLVNLSARAHVGGGAGTLIGGFVICGPGTLRVLLRGVGPTLASQAVSGVLADPELQLFRGDEAIAQNDDWEGADALRAAFASAGAFELPAQSRDSALIATLPAGVYTTHVTGKNSTTGVALVEIYALP